MAKRAARRGARKDRRPEAGAAVHALETLLLKELAVEGARTAPIVRTSRELGERLELSQQSADRYLVALEGQGLIVRQVALRRQRLSLTEAGVERLRTEYAGYRRLFEGASAFRFTGEVRSGLGEGRYYLSLPGYARQFTSRLGYDPFPGTLNVGVPAPDRGALAALKAYSGIRIDGFEASGRTFGGATCLVARIRDAACHAIVPDRTHHTDVVELIAPRKLRDLLHLKDGDAVDVEIRES